MRDAEESVRELKNTRFLDSTINVELSKATSETYGAGGAMRGHGTSRRDEYAPRDGGFRGDRGSRQPPPAARGRRDPHDDHREERRHAHERQNDVHTPAQNFSSMVMSGAMQP